MATYCAAEAEDQDLLYLVEKSEKSLLFQMQFSPYAKTEPIYAIHFLNLHVSRIQKMYHIIWLSSGIRKFIQFTLRFLRRTWLNFGIF